MSFVEKDSALWREFVGIAEVEGLRLYDLEVQGTNSLRVFIEAERPEVVPDAEGQQHGVSSDDCSRVCRRLVIFLLAEGPALGVGAEPQIEVSSPGINRGLRLREHFERAVGERVKIGYQQQDTIHWVEGRLASIVGDEVRVVDETMECDVCIPFLEIKKAHVSFQFESGKRKKKVR